MGLGGGDMEGVGAAACCWPRWQRGPDWPGARAAACLRPSPPPEPSHFLCARCQGAGAREQCRLRTAAHRPWLVALARSPATIATPAAASRAMNLPRGLLVAWTLSLWPGTFPPSPPFASGSSLVLQDLCSSCEEKDETRLPWHYLGTQV